MQTVILPGKSVSNKEWVELVAKKINTEGIVRPILWDHWTDPNETFDPKEKADLIARHAKGDNMNIVAKSVGTLVASYIINLIPEQINKVIICGIPFKDLSTEQNEIIKNTLSKLPPNKLLIYQNAGDPHGTAEEIKNLFGDSVNVNTKSSDDHNYPYFEEFESFISV